MNPIRKYMNRIKDSRLRTKILLSNLVIILFITTVIGGATIYASNRFIEANTRDLSMQVVHQVAENIDNRAKEIFNSTIYLISDILIRQTVSEKSEPITAENYPLLFTKMEFLLAQYGNSTPYINSVIIKTNSGYVFWWGNKKEVNTKNRFDHLS
jgi:two-component system sensor histidine kinase YesM